MASSFPEEPITVRRHVSASLLRESRERASVRPTTPVPASFSVEDPVVSIEVREINASRTYDPRSD